MTTTRQSQDAIGLSDPSYLRERQDPQPGDPFYLHLSDLLMALRKHGTTARCKVLDFGCGGSPYHSLFPNADYRTADIEAAANVYHRIDSTGQTDAPSDSFDIVLSTQVLEHCPEPGTYLRECRRVMRSDGRLILTTHGLFEEHGCPYDFHRWTEEGLRNAICDAGFHVREMTKLTLGPRAGLMLFQRSVVNLMLEERSQLIRRSWWLARRIVLARRRLWDPLTDWLFPQHRILASGRHIPGDSFYIALLAVAEPA